MIRIHATKKLLAKLPVDESGCLPVQAKTENRYSPSIAEADNPLSHWHANLLTLQRRNCILLVHDQTRFPLFIPCLTKPDFKQLQWYFDDVLMNTLLKIGATHEQLEAATQLLQPLVFDANNNRSVQGTLNNRGLDIDHMLYYDSVDIQDVSAYRTGAWLAERPCNVKGQKDCIWPKKAMLDLLSDAAAQSVQNVGGSSGPLGERELSADKEHVGHDPSSNEQPDNVVSLADYRLSKDK